MKAYLISLLTASLAVILVGILSPRATSGQLKLISSLFLICVLIAPLPSLLSSIPELPGITEPLPEEPDSSYRDQMQESLLSASKAYFADALTSLLEQQFSISPGQLRCAVQWEDAEDQPTPKKITLLLSGAAIWKDPHKMESFVSELLGCECVTVIE